MSEDQRLARAARARRSAVGAVEEKSSGGNIIKFQKAFNKMVEDAHGNIFIGTDKYIRYITVFELKCRCE